MFFYKRLKLKFTKVKMSVGSNPAQAKMETDRNRNFGLNGFFRLDLFCCKLRNHWTDGAVAKSDFTLRLTNAFSRAKLFHDKVERKCNLKGLNRRHSFYIIYILSFFNIINSIFYILHYKKWANPGLFFAYFWSFQTNTTNALEGILLSVFNQNQDAKEELPMCNNVWFIQKKLLLHAVNI